jgi:predicted DNA-binding protein (UPF0251 family)
VAGRSGRTRTQRAAELADRRAEMLRLYTVERLTQAEIADRYGVSQQAVSEQIRKAIADRPAYRVDEHRAIELEKLDEYERAARRVLVREHVTVSRGSIVTMYNEETGREEPLLDDAPALAAVDRLVRISQYRADLIGMKAPTRVSVEAETLSAEIAQLLSTVLPAGDDDDTADAGP